MAGPWLRKNSHVPACAVGRFLASLMSLEVNEGWAGAGPERDQSGTRAGGMGGREKVREDVRVRST